MKKLLLLLVVVTVALALYRRVTSSRGRHRHAHVASGGAHLHGTPDHWPPVVRKPESERAPAA